MNNNDEFDNVIVKKGWGSEYLIFRNENLAIWLLSIDYNQETSLHAHCLKQTGLIVLDGIAKISFLNNSIILKGLDKIQIFNRRFHSTKSLSKRGTFLLEVENPVDKHDLVRFKDVYGRVDKPYEGKEHHLIKDETCVWLEPNKNTELHNCNLIIKEISSKEEIFQQDFEDMIVFLKGGIISKKNELIVCPGDVTSYSNIQVLLEQFDISPNSMILFINKK